MDDFKEPSQLIGRLRDATQGSDPVSLYLKGKLSLEFQQQIQAYQDETQLSQEMKGRLVGELNTLIEKAFYKQEIFACIKLSDETQRILSSKDLMNTELQRLNRLLLEDAYPQQIVNGQKSQAECEAIGRSKGGLSTKIHATCDALGNPTSFYLTPGQAHDLEGADALLPSIQADALLADKAYDADERVRQKLEERDILVVIPSKENRKEPIEYDRHLFKARHLIENFFQKLKQYRAIATRYDKTARNFLGAIYCAASVILLT